MHTVFGCSAPGSKRCGSFDVVRSRFLGSVWNQGHAEASIISQDGGYSYNVPGGSLWWFGDTPEESWDLHRIWPLGGIYVNGKSYIYYSLIELTGKGTWNFRSVGSGLACSAQPLSLHKRIQTPEGWRFPVKPSAIVTTDDWIYLFDVEKRGGQQGVWLSRVRPGEIENPNDYQFYCGPGPTFSRDKNKQILLLEKIYGQVSIIWNEHLKKYVLASSSDFSRPREIRFHTANEPFGPWSKAVASITVPEYRQGKKVELVYCSYFHPELFRENGRIMNLTFSLHLEDAGFDANNEMVEVEVKSCRK